MSGPVCAYVRALSDHSLKRIARKGSVELDLILWTFSQMLCVLIN